MLLTTCDQDFLSSATYDLHNLAGGHFPPGLNDCDIFLVLTAGYNFQESYLRR